MNFCLMRKGPYQDSPIGDALQDGAPALWEPVVEDSGGAQCHPACVQATRSSIQLVDLGIAHPYSHQATANVHCHNRMLRIIV